MPNEYIIVSPCFNEGLVITKFLNEIECKLSKIEDSFIVIIVDDASNDSTIQLLREYQFRSRKFILKVIELKFNMGHQEAIRQGLIYAKSLNRNISGIIVMDSDGEDDPNAIVDLIALEDFDIVFVERGKRKESLSFRLGYFNYRLLFKLVTGKSISFGNYSIISPLVLSAIVNQSFFHYAGFLSKQKFKTSNIRYDRQERIDSHSKMSYKNLVFHGLYSLIEYAEEIVFFLLKIFFVILIISFILAGFVLYSKYISHKAISGWASSIGTNLVLSGLIIMSTALNSLLMLSIKKSINQNGNQFREVK